MNNNNVWALLFDITSSFVRLFLINIDEMQPVPRITAIDGVPYRFVRKTKIVATYLDGWEHLTRFNTFDGAAPVFLNPLLWLRLGILILDILNRRK